MDTLLELVFDVVGAVVVALSGTHARSGLAGQLVRRFRTVAN